jgi:phosphatidylserine/phosphatidylglycerophosphate/cardiolipin synthase-like enzyme
VAAPYLHVGFVGLLVPDVRRVVAAGGHVQLITRALSQVRPGGGGANSNAVALLRDAAADAPGRLEVASWEEAGLGVHFKVVLAHRSDGVRVAYIGSSNLTPGGTLGHAEAGVLARGPQIDLLAHWLDMTAAELSRRRLPSG